MNDLSNRWQSGRLTQGSARPTCIPRFASCDASGCVGLLCVRGERRLGGGCARYVGVGALWRGGEVEDGAMSVGRLRSSAALVVILLAYGAPASAQPAASGDLQARPADPPAGDDGSAGDDAPIPMTGRTIFHAAYERVLGRRPLGAGAGRDVRRRVVRPRPAHGRSRDLAGLPLRRRWHRGRVVGDWWARARALQHSRLDVRGRACIYPTRLIEAYWSGSTPAGRGSPRRA